MSSRMVICLFFAFLLAGCAPEQLTPDEAAYEQFCEQTNGAWMKMSEMKDGKVVGPSCYGCMPDDKNHLCTQQAYEAYL